jgi:hypothetical protein
MGAPRMAQAALYAGEEDDTEYPFDDTEYP